MQSTNRPITIDSSSAFIEGLNKEWGKIEAPVAKGHQIGIVVKLLKSTESDEMVAQFLAKHFLQHSKAMANSKRINQAVQESGRGSNYQELCQKIFKENKALPTDVSKQIITESFGSNFKQMRLACQVDSAARKSAREKLLQDLPIIFHIDTGDISALGFGGNWDDIKPLKNLFRELAALVAILQLDSDKLSFKEQAHLLAIDLAVNSVLAEKAGTFGGIPATGFTHILVAALLDYAQGASLDAEVPYSEGTMGLKGGSTSIREIFVQAQMEESKLTQGLNSLKSELENPAQHVDRSGKRIFFPYIKKDLQHCIDRDFDRKVKSLIEKIMFADSMPGVELAIAALHNDPESFLSQLPPEILHVIGQTAIELKMKESEGGEQG